MITPFIDLQYLSYIPLDGLMEKCGIAERIIAEKITWHNTTLTKPKHCYTLLLHMKTHRNPVPTVDIIIEINDGIILIERKNPPHGWAIPGGFVDYGESLEAAARREAKEETSLTIKSLFQFYTYSDPERDPRQHTISTVFIAKGEGTPRAGDDAKNVAIFNELNLPEPLAFDHRKILGDYYKWKKSGESPRLQGKVDSQCFRTST
jgi:8-oxo-dGTP diphosphatase